MKKTLIKILEILTKKDKKNIFLSVIFLLTKSVLEVLGIGLIIPILNFTVSENNQSILNEYIPFLNNLTNKESIVFFVVIFIFIYFVKTAFVLFYSTWSNRFVNNLSVDLTRRVLERYLGRDYIFFLENNSAYLIRNVSSETGLFALGLVGNIISSMTQIVFVISVCTFLIIYNFYSLYVILILIFLCGLIVTITNKKFKKWGEIRQQESASFLKKLHEVIGSIKEVILYNKKSLSLEEVHFHSKKFADANIYRDTVIAFTGPIIEFIGILIFFSFLLILIIYSSLGLSKIIVLFGVFAFACIKLLPAVISLIRSVQGIKFNMPACDVIHKILVNFDTSYNFQETKETKKIDLESLHFENVSFAYKSQKKPTLDNLTFDLNKGEKIAIVGETGSGKTTLLNLISSLISPSSGKIKINDLEQLNFSKDIRRHIGYVSQSVYLSDNSILFNIALTNKVDENDKKKIMSILELLNLSSIYSERINETSSIGERGSKLSGGQIQRIGLARALYRDPDILILDEATNALDRQTETQILNYLFEKMKNKIVILCTHKKELLKHCNKIIEVKNNTITIKKNKVN